MLAGGAGSGEHAARINSLGRWDAWKADSWGEWGDGGDYGPACLEDGGRVALSLEKGPGGRNPPPFRTKARSSPRRGRLGSET